MTTEWSLDELYKGFDDPAYGKDVAELTAQIDALATLIADAGRMQEKERTEKVLAAQSGIAQLFYQLSLYVLSLIHISEPRDGATSRMPSSA